MLTLCMLTAVRALQFDTTLVTLIKIQGHIDVGKMEPNFLYPSLHGLVEFSFCIIVPHINMNIDIVI